MMNITNSVLMGAVAMASLVAALFFLRYWSQTRDNLFLLFSLAFCVDGVTRFILGLSYLSNEAEPYFYLARLITFGLIIFGVLQKNRPTNR